MSSQENQNDLNDDNAEDNDSKLTPEEEEDPFNELEDEQMAQEEDNQNIKNENNEEIEENQEGEQENQEGEVDNQGENLNEELNEEKEPEEDEIIQIDHDRLKIDLDEDTEIYEAKLNVITTLQQKIFNPETYQPEESIKTTNEQGNTQYKAIPLENYIRWKYVEDENNDKTMVSNAKLIELSDGSHQLVIGNKFIDVNFSNMENVRYAIDVGNNINIIGKKVSKRMLLSTDIFQGLKRQQSDHTSKIQLSYSFYDKTIFKKEEYGSKYSRRRNINKEIKEQEKLEKLGKKRKREDAD